MIGSSILRCLALHSSTPPRFIMEYFFPARKRSQTPAQLTIRVSPGRVRVIVPLCRSIRVTRKSACKNRMTCSRPPLRHQHTAPARIKPMRQATPHQRMRRFDGAFSFAARFTASCLYQDAIQGLRSSTAFPVSKSAGTETWSCTMNHLPLIFCRPLVTRSHKSDFWPFFVVPLSRSSA